MRNFRAEPDFLRLVSEISVASMVVRVRDPRSSERWAVYSELIIQLRSVSRR